jgi:hypothetical protein
MQEMGLSPAASLFCYTGQLVFGNKAAAVFS